MLLAVEVMAPEWIRSHTVPCQIAAELCNAIVTPRYATWPHESVWQAISTIAQ